MSVLVIGGDKIDPIKNILKNLGTKKVNHWDARKKASTCKKIIPLDTKCIVMITTHLNHNAMKHFKHEAKKRDLPIVCSKSSISCIYEEYTKVMGSQCKDCDSYEQCDK